MKTKTTLLALALCAHTGLSLAALDTGFVAEIRQNIDNIITSIAAFKSQSALIQSETDLQFYATLTYENFPLNKLNPRDKKVFVDSLAFSDKQLVSFNYKILNQLSVTEAYQILSLFGAQHYLYLIDNKAGKKANIYSQYQDELDSIEGISSEILKNKSFEQFYYDTYKSELDGIQTEQLTQQRLQEILSVFKTITFYSQNSDIAENYLHYFKLFEEKGWAETEHYEQVYAALINARLFAQADAFYQTYKNQGLVALPAIIDNATTDTAIIVYASSKKLPNTMVKQVFAFSPDKEIIVLAHPHCHFCNYAAQALHQNKKLTEFIAQHATWLSLPERKFEPEVMNKWSEKYPEFDISYVNYFNDFPQFDFWGTPSFYFLQNGVVKDTFIGWPKEQDIEQFTEKINTFFNSNL